MCNVGAERLSGPYVQCKAWENISIGHPELYTFAFRVSKVRFLFSILLNIAQHPRSVSLFSDHKVFLSVSTLSLKWQYYFWTMTPKGFTIHLFCLSKHIWLILTTWMPGLRRYIIGNSLVLCSSVPSPLVPAKETSRQYPGRAGFWRAPVLVCQSWHPALKHSISTLVCLMLSGPGSRSSCRNGWDVSSGWWSTALLFHKVLCFTGLRLAPLGSWSSRSRLWSWVQVRAS